MKKIVFGTIAAATMIASVTAASAQMRSERNWLDLDLSMVQTQDGGASYGYNKDLNSFDAIK